MDQILLEATELPIADAAHTALDLERGGPFSGRGDIRLGDTFTDQETPRNFARLEFTAPLRLYRLQNVTLDASLMLLLLGRRPIPETRHMIDETEWERMLVASADEIPHDPGEHYVIACNRSWRNYYHWMMQSVPAIDWSLQRRTHPSPTLVLGPLQPWQEETLSLLGCQHVPRLPLHPTGHYHFPNAEFSDFLGERMPRTASSAAMATFQRLSANVSREGGAAEAIYVARTDVRNRVVENEAELIDLLERQGVRVIVPGRLSVREQIAAFRAARLVIGPHGAGMTNIVFCQPGSFVYELLPRCYPHNAFNRAAQAAGLNYWADLFTGEIEGPVHERTWCVDLDIVAARLAEIRKRLTAARPAETAMSFLRRTQVTYPDGASPPEMPEPAVAADTPAPRGPLRRSLRGLRRLVKLG